MGTKANEEKQSRKVGAVGKAGSIFFDEKKTKKIVFFWIFCALLFEKNNNG
jgi:hypothetical protein